MKENNKIDIRNYFYLLFKKNWHKPCIIDVKTGNIYTYRDVLRIALLMRDTLATKNVGYGDTIVTIIPNSCVLAIMYFTALITGFRIVPVDPEKGKKEKEDIISQVDYKLLLVSDKDHIQEKALNIDFILDLMHHNQEEISQKELNVFQSLDTDKIFLITFTSGSTGVPKGVMHSFENIFQSAFAFGNTFAFSSKNIFYHNLAMSYMAGILNTLFMPLIFGSQIVIDEVFSIGRIINFWDVPISYKVNTFWFIPTIIALLMKLDRANIGVNYLKGKNIIACIGTAPLDKKLKKLFEERYKINLYESYGLSETLFLTTNSPKAQSDGVGKPLDGTKLEILKDGEIQVIVPWLFKGYLSKPNKRKNSNTFLTGDMGDVDVKGFLKILGRKKDIIIRGGMNISTARINNFISECAFFEEFTVIGVKDEILGEKIICFYADDEIENEKRKQIQSLIERNLGKMYTVDEFIKVSEIPKNLNGKINTFELKNAYAKGIL